MALILIRTNKHSFVVDESNDALHERMSQVYGRSVHLFATRIVTPGNPKGTMSYSYYCSDVLIPVCNNSDIVEKREANQQESDIFNRLLAGRKLLKADREYLSHNFIEK